ncbi:MAG: DUF2460 domain-containing protein [Formivibrio sp.]|nr:DUF2460 domain-containing protein [Formivibrio sp.]
MSNSVYPDLPGMKLDATVSPRFSTKIQSAISGRETRAAFMAYPLWDITLAYEFLRSNGAFPELDTLAGFFMQMKGSWDSFLISIPNDNAVTDMQFGMGNGVQTVFQLTRTRGAGGFGFTEPCQNPAALTNIKGNGSVISSGGYSIGSTGLITFVTAPAVGTALTWSGSFYYRCRFVNDTADFSRFMQDLWSLGSIKMTGATGNKV